MTTPSVSVLIPCRNGEPYLEETLASAVGQSLAPTEILVVDDGSTDRSRDVAAKFAPKVRILDNIGQGASAARERASREATGDYFQYLDADDLLEPRALEQRVDILQQSQADVAVSDWSRLVRVDGEWRPTRTHSGALPTTADPPDVQIFSGFWAPPAAVLYRRWVWERVGEWRPTLPIIQDARFLFDAARVGARFSHVPAIGALYRQHATNSLSTSSPARFWNDILTNTLEVEEMWRGEGMDSSRRRALANSYAACVQVGLRCNRELFRRSLAELRRFPDHNAPLPLKVAIAAARIVGYRPVSSIVSLPGLRSRV